MGTIRPVFLKSFLDPRHTHFLTILKINEKSQHFFSFYDESSQFVQSLKLFLTSLNIFVMRCFIVLAVDVVFLFVSDPTLE
jgi:hypothetical protein